MSYIFAISYCSWSSPCKNTEVVCHSLLQWTTFCQTSPPWPVCLAWPQMAQLSFVELDKAVVHVIRLASCDCSFSLSALWSSGSVSTILLGFHLPWMWGLSSWLLQQSAADTPYLRCGVASLGCGPWLASLGSSFWICSCTITMLKTYQLCLMKNKEFVYTKNNF